MTKKSCEKCAKEIEINPRKKGFEPFFIKADEHKNLGRLRKILFGTMGDKSYYCKDCIEVR